jgi:hypothetical protein
MPNNKSNIISRQDRPLQSFIFSSSVPDGAVNIAFVETERVSPQCVLSINEGLNLFPENKDEYYIDIQYLNDGIKSYAVKSKYFLITSQYNALNTPLFYRHSLQYSVWVDPLGKTTTSVYDNEKVVDTRIYNYNSQSKCIYHNLLNNEESIYKVKYTAADENNNLLGDVVEVLNGALAFIPMDYTMLTCLNRLSMHSSGYELHLNKDSSTNTAYPYIITLPTISKWALKYISGRGIRLYNNNVNSTEPWYLDITANQIIKVFEHTLDGDTAPYVYTIPEFYAQNFNPYPPYILNKLDQSTYINSHTIKVSKSNLLVGPNYPLDIIITDAAGNYKIAFSTNLQKTRQEDVEWLPINLQNIDLAGGYVVLSEDISFTDLIYATYHSETYTYKFTPKNFNPCFDQALFGQEVIIYCKPIIQNNYFGLTPTYPSLYYIVFNLDGSIYDTLNYEYITNDPELHVGNDLSSPVTVNTKNGFLSTYAYPNSRRWLILGSVTTNPVNTISNSIVLDSRSSGGGLKEEISNNESFRMAHPETSWYWDLGYYIGRPFPAAGAVVIKIPSSVVDSFTDEQIRAKILKHAALGIYPIIEFYYKCGDGYGTSPYGTCPYGD